jgi:hypothetical protein
MSDRPMDATASATDAESVTAVATEYFQSWFAGDGERMRACLHPALAKRTPLEPAASLRLDEDSAEQLVAHTAAGGGAGSQTWLEVTVLATFRDIATVAVRSEPFVEYLHLARFGDRWLIVNALYSPRADRGPASGASPMAYQ